MSVYSKRPCGPRRSRRNPTAWSKEDLVAEVTKRRLMNKTTARRSRISELCAQLERRRIPVPKVSREKSPDKRDQCMIPLNSDLTVRDHQIKVVQHLLHNRGLVAIHETGTGKTLTAVTAMRCIIAKFPSINKIIVVSPVSLLENFEKEMIKFGLDLTQEPYKSKVKLFSYDGFHNAYHNRRLDVCDNSFLIVDEAHNLRNPIDLNATKKKGVKTATIIKCAKKAAKVLLLTGTPMKNRPSDLINLINIVDGKSHSEGPTVKYFDQVIMNPENENEFNRYFECKISYVTKSKDDPDYPKRIDKDIVRLTMDKHYYDRYFDIQAQKKREFIRQLYGRTDNLSLFYSALRQASLSLDGENSPKVQWAWKLIKHEMAAAEREKNNPSDQRTTHKIVLYSSWKKSGLWVIKKLLDKAKIPYGLITGEQTAAQRKFYKDQYNRGDVKILLISRAGGEGLDLKETRHIILLDPNWNEGDDEQIIGRGIRYLSHANLPPSERYVNVWKVFMVKPSHLKKADDDKKMMGSVDEILYKMGQDKKKDIDATLRRLKPLSIENRKCGRRAEK